MNSYEFLQDVRDLLGWLSSLARIVMQTLSQTGLVGTSSAISAHNERIPHLRLVRLTDSPRSSRLDPRFVRSRWSRCRTSPNSPATSRSWSVRKAPWVAPPSLFLLLLLLPLYSVVNPVNSVIWLRRLPFVHPSGPQGPQDAQPRFPPPSVNHTFEAFIFVFWDIYWTRMP